jgi:hypothetical protein
LQLLRGIGMLDCKLAKGLANPMAAAFLRDLVEVVVRQVEFVADPSIGPESFPHPDGLSLGLMLVESSTTG